MSKTVNHKPDDIRLCDCGQEPSINKIGEWPAQYRIVCKCGQTARGVYYGSHRAEFRHRAALKSAVERWNKREFEISS